MQGNESGIDWSGWAVISALCAIMVAWAKKADPRQLLAWINEPLVRPLHDRLDRHERKLDKICKVLDRDPNTAKALQEINAQHDRWD